MCSLFALIVRLLSVFCVYFNCVLAVGVLVCFNWGPAVGVHCLL